MIPSNMIARFVYVQPLLVSNNICSVKYFTRLRSARSGRRPDLIRFRTYDSLTLSHFAAATRDLKEFTRTPSQVEYTTTPLAVTGTLPNIGCLSPWFAALIRALVSSECCFHRENIGCLSPCFAFLIRSLLSSE
jgi:hypothetical protein